MYGLAGMQEKGFEQEENFKSPSTSEPQQRQWLTHSTPYA